MQRNANKFLVMLAGVFTVMLMWSIKVLADGEAGLPVVPVPAPAEVPINEIISGMLKAIGDWRAIGWQAGLAASIAVLISTMKNSLLRAWIWDKLGWWKVFVAPVLAMVAVLIFVKPFDMKAVMLALTTGAGAIAIHQFLDALKNAPFIKPWMTPILDFLAKLLKSPVVPSEEAAKKEAAKQ